MSDETRVYELNAEGFRRYLIVPCTATYWGFTALLLVLVVASGWFLLALLAYLALLAWRAAALRMRADATGVEVRNVIRRYRMPWSEVKSIWANEGWPGPAVKIERARGPFSGVAIQATYGMGKARRRTVALELASLGRSLGYGFTTGDSEDLEALRRAGLWDVTDPEILEAWWEARESTKDG